MQLNNLELVEADNVGFSKVPKDAVHCKLPLLSPLFNATPTLEVLYSSVIKTIKAN